MVKVALIQQSCLQNKKDNIEKSLNFIRQAANLGSELVVLPELHCTQYFCHKEDTNYFDLAEPIPGQSSQVFTDLAKKLKIVLIISLFEKRIAGLYHNTALIIEKDGNIVGKYRKMHIPDDPAYYEKFYFTPGDLGFKPIQTSIGKLGLLICWDQWFPEAARLMALQGAQMLIYPTAIGLTPEDTTEEQEKQKQAWIISQRAHAIANSLPVLSINRIGQEQINGQIFWGSSFIAGPQGEILKMASENKEEIIVQEIDLNKTDQIRRIWPFLRDRRIEAYDGLLHRFID